MTVYLYRGRPISAEEYFAREAADRERRDAQLAEGHAKIERWRAERLRRVEWPFRVALACLGVAAVAHAVSAIAGVL